MIICIGYRNEKIPFNFYPGNCKRNVYRVMFPNLQVAYNGGTLHQHFSQRPVLVFWREQGRVGESRGTKSAGRECQILYTDNRLTEMAILGIVNCNEDCGNVNFYQLFIFAHTTNAREEAKRRQQPSSISHICSQVKLLVIYKIHLILQVGSW